MLWYLCGRVITVIFTILFSVILEITIETTDKSESTTYTTTGNYRCKRPPNLCIIKDDKSCQDKLLSVIVVMNTLKQIVVDLIVNFMNISIYLKGFNQISELSLDVGFI